MLDPFVDGRSGVGGADHPALSFAPERDSTPPEIALAYVSVFKAPQKAVPSTNRAGPHGAAPMAAATAPAADLAVRSHDVSARTGGVAGGLAGRLDASYREPKR